MQNILFNDIMGGIAVERIERDFNFNMLTKHFHNEYEIYYLINGERYYFIEKQIHYVKKGSLVFIERNQIHKTVGANTNYHDRILMLISEDEMKQILSLCGIIDMANSFSKNFGIIELSESGQKHVECILFSLIREMKLKQSHHEQLVRFKLAELMIYALRCKSGENSTEKAEPITTEKYKKISEIAQYINEYYHSDISLADISRDFYISKCYLSRIFKEITGFTVNEYINIVRIKRAQQLLEHTNHSITEVAELIGYESITYFEKIFKKYLETSPLKYRKKFTRKLKE